MHTQPQKFEKSMDPFLLVPEYRRDDVKLYTAGALRYAEWLVAKASGVVWMAGQPSYTHRGMWHDKVKRRA